MVGLFSTSHGLKIRLASPDFFEDGPGPCEDFGDLFEADAVVPDVGHVGDDEGAACVEGEKCDEVIPPVLGDFFHDGVFFVFAWECDEEGTADGCDDDADC